MSATEKNKTGEEAATQEQNTAGAIAATEDQDYNPLVVRFKKPYTFEGKVYEHVDLSKMEDLTGADLFTANKVFNQEAGYMSSKPETDPKFCYMIASLVTGLPLEFYNRMPIRNANKIKDAVFDFFQDAD